MEGAMDVYGFMEGRQYESPSRTNEHASSKLREPFRCLAGNMGIICVYYCDPWNRSNEYPDRI